jgi:hypothetical protein
MLQRIRVAFGIAAIVIIMVLAVALPRLIATSGSSAASAPLTMALVCQVQPGCVFNAGTTGIDVDVVMTNNSASPISVAAFNFAVYSSNKAFLTPGTPIPNAPAYAAGGCTTDPPLADNGAYGSSATGSTVSCFNAGSPTGDIVIAALGSVTVGTVHFTGAGPDSADLILTNAAASGTDGTGLLACDPAAGPPAAPSGAGLADCSPATVIVGQGGATSTPAATATSTATPTPTATPCGGGACATPVGVPTGAPSDVLLLNSSNCITLGIFFGGLTIIGAVSDCQNLQEQLSYSPGGLSHYVGCLREEVDDGLYFCADASTVGQVLPSDFSRVDLDRDQAHDGQDLLVLSFVTADYPVAFETDAGTFISRTTVNLDQAYTCFNGNAHVVSGSGDPDCDGLAATAGDGVVVARLRIDETTPRGTHHLTVTQGATSIVKDFHVAGIPTSMTLTTLAGKTSIETGATAPHRLVPPFNVLPTDCVFALEDATTGLPDRPEKAVVIAKALDSDGTEVVGSILNWDHPFVDFGSSSPQFSPLPQGGVALPQSPTVDLGAAGVGAPQVLCGGDTPGLLTGEVGVTNLLSTVEDTSVHAVYAINVVPPSPSLVKVPDGAGANVNRSVPAANLWLCNICGTGPGEGSLVVHEVVSDVHTNPSNLGIGAYEFDVQFDQFVIQSVNPTDVIFSAGCVAPNPVDDPTKCGVAPLTSGGVPALQRGAPNCSMTMVAENLVRFGCVTPGPNAGPAGGFELARLRLVPAADDVRNIFPGSGNGITTIIKDGRCVLADTLGRPVVGASGTTSQLPVCGDLAVTVRILEGDVNLDCRVDVADEALIALHYGAVFGSALYDKWFDLEPRFHDADIDTKDLQRVFGRDGSTCQQPIPAQPPVVPPTGLVFSSAAPLHSREAGAGTGAATTAGPLPAQIAVEPSAVVLAPGDLVTVDVTAKNVLDLAAFDVTLQFDSRVLEYVDAASGSFLSSTGREAACALPQGSPPLTAPENVNRNGALDMHCNTRGLIADGAGNAGPAGDGALAHITFRAREAGVSALTLRGAGGTEPYFVVGDSGEIGFTTLARVERCSPCDDAIGIPFDVVDATVDVVAPATDTPTATETATPTATSTPTSTATHTPQPARQGGGGSAATSTALPSPVATATSTPVNAVLSIAATPRPRPQGRILLPDTGFGPTGGVRLWFVLPAMIAAGALLLVAAGVRLRRRHTRIG